MKRYKCVVSYLGRNYNGWQTQKHGASVQEEIERVIHDITRSDIRIVAAGRTDAKVNAKGQVFHFDTELEMTPYKWKGALNGHLPKDIHIVSVEEVDHLFHARFCAKEKRYDYKINLGEYNVFEKDFVYQCPYALDVDLMKQASKYFIGTHDFTSFCSNSKDEMEDQVRTVYDIVFQQDGDVLTISYYGQGFLRYMVRMMSAALIEVGRGMFEVSHVFEMLEAKSKTMTRKNANAEGLTLVEIKYFDLLAETPNILIREPLLHDPLLFDWGLDDLVHRIEHGRKPCVYLYTSRDATRNYGYFVLYEENGVVNGEFLLFNKDEGMKYFDFIDELKHEICKREKQETIRICVNTVENAKNRL